MTEQKTKPNSRPMGHYLIIAVGGFVLGAATVALAGWALMPGMMLEVQPSRLGFEETVWTIEESIVANGWVHSGTRDMQKSLAGQGVHFPHRVKVIELCRPEYADSVLTTDRHVATLMPCAFAVYEDDDGNVMISRMNTGQMGTMLGGNIAEVMGKSVTADEKRILSSVLQ
jgi:uncharacterized protein (DUF302 family)